jgi:hypothetical protein
MEGSIGEAMGRSIARTLAEPLGPPGVSAKQRPDS